MKKKTYFQDHGDHNQSVVTIDLFIDEVMPSICEWIPVASAKAPMPKKPKTDFIALQRSNEDVTFLGLISVTPKRNTVASIYPLAKGKLVDVTISKVYEWKDPFEAFVWATIGDDLEFCFLATDYFCNKDKYLVGAKLQIELAAIGVEITRGHEDFTLDSEEAKHFYEHMDADELERDEDGNIIPITMSCSNMVALLPASDECPDFFQFHSPIQSYEEITIGEQPFCKLGIVISHETEDIEIPLYFNKVLCENLADSPNIMGGLWLQAHLPGAFVYEEN